MLHFDAKYQNRIHHLLKSLQKGNYKHDELDENGFTALISAVRNNNELGVSVLLSFNIDTEVQDIYGRTALHWACITNRIHLVKILITNYAKVNVYDNLNKRPIEYIIENKNYKILDILSSVSSVSDIKDLYKNSLLRRNYKIIESLTTFRLLRENEIELFNIVIIRDDSYALYKILGFIDKKCHILFSLYSLWVQEFVLECIKKKSNNCLSLIIKYLHNKNFSDILTHGESFLHFCIRNNNNEAVEIFIKNGANPVKRNVFNMVPLHYAILYKRYNLFETLKTYDFDVNQIDFINNECFLEYLIEVPEYILFFTFAKKTNLYNLYVCLYKLITCSRQSSLIQIKKDETQYQIFQKWKYFLKAWNKKSDLKDIGSVIRSFLF